MKNSINRAGWRLWLASFNALKNNLYFKVTFLTYFKTVSVFQQLFIQISTKLALEHDTLINICNIYVYVFNYI